MNISTQNTGTNLETKLPKVRHMSRPKLFSLVLPKPISIMVFSNVGDPHMRQHMTYLHVSARFTTRLANSHMSFKWVNHQPQNEQIIISNFTNKTNGKEQWNMSYRHRKPKLFRILDPQVHRPSHLKWC